MGMVPGYLMECANSWLSSMMDHTWRKCQVTSLWQLAWYTAELPKHNIKCTWAKQSASASSYRGKILGGIMTQLILNAAASKCHDAIPLVVVGCDNNGVVSHRNEPPPPIFYQPVTGRYSLRFQKPHFHSAIPHTIQIHAVTCQWHKEMARLFSEGTNQHQGG